MKRKHKLILNGREVTAKEFHRRRVGGGGIAMVSRAYQDHKPLISEGLGCMRGQVDEMRDELRQHNIRGVRVLDTGQLEITSRQGRRELCRLRSLRDADGGYGDEP